MTQLFYYLMLWLFVALDQVCCEFFFLKSFIEQNIFLSIKVYNRLRGECYQTQYKVSNISIP